VVASTLGSVGLDNLVAAIEREEGLGRDVRGLMARGMVLLRDGEYAVCEGGDFAVSHDMYVTAKEI
jgi:hypothetical protein